MFNWIAVEKQIIGFVIFVLFLILIKSIWFGPSKNFTKHSLLLNVNTASFKQLIDVPYIGPKTAEHILNLRKKVGRFRNLEELKSIRNFKKFKNYLKVE